MKATPTPRSGMPVLTAEPAETGRIPGPALCRAPATSGELVQGATEAGDFLVNCPIDLFAEARVTPSEVPGIGIDGQFTKVERAIGIVSTAFGLTAGHRVEVSSPIPRGKGMASSTADITAGLAAFLRANALSVPPSVFGAVLAAVEPSDCVHYDGIAHVDHLSGHLHEALPVPQGLRVLVLDCGGEVDTMAFDRERARAVYATHGGVVRHALARLKRGLATGNVHDVGYAATLSARLSQEILFKPQFDGVLRIARQLGAVGVNCAHSGSVLGILYREADRLYDLLRYEVAATFGRDLTCLGDHAVIGGGCRAVRP